MSKGLFMEDGYLAFLDVLGFRKNIISHESSKYINEYLSILNRTVSRKLERKANTLDYLVFSDSIIITSKGTDFIHFYSMLNICSKLLYSLTFNHIPIRGSIAFGPFLRTSINGNNNNMFIAGPALVEAFEFETRQNWIGISLCSSVNDKHYDLLKKWTWKDNDTEDYQIYKHLYKYNEIPLHSGTNTDDYLEGFVVFPKATAYKNSNIKNVFLDKLNHLKVGTIDPNVRTKYSNSLKLFEQIEELFPAAPNVR